MKKRKSSGFGFGTDVMTRRRRTNFQATTTGNCTSTQFDANTNAATDDQGLFTSA